MKTIIATMAAAVFALEPCRLHATTTSRAPLKPFQPTQTEIRPLLIGASVPGLALQTPDGRAFDMRGAITKKPTVVIFYRERLVPLLQHAARTTGKPSSRNSSNWATRSLPSVRTVPKSWGRAWRNTS